jgi:hypothetical protein
LQHIEESLDARLHMGVEHEIGVALERQNRQMYSVAEDYITYASVTERLDIMDNAIHTPPVQLGDDILSAASYGVGIGIVAVLLGKRAAWVRHDELALCFIKDRPGSIVLNIGVKPCGEHRGHTDVGNTK